MGIRMDIVIWTVAFLSSAPNLKGEPSAIPGSSRNEVISNDPSVTSYSTAVETQSTLAPVNTTLQAHGTLETRVHSSQASTHTAVPGSITSPNAVSRTAQDTSLSFGPVKKTTVMEESVTTPASTVTLLSQSSENQTFSTQSTMTVSEAATVVPSASPSGQGPTLTVITDNPQTTRLAPLENFNQDTPSELDVGDEASGEGSPASPLDLLLTGLVSVFIFSTALLSIMLFLRFRQQSQHPEFHRLHDLPMDDLLEDTPLSRYPY